MFTALPENHDSVPFLSIRLHLLTTVCETNETNEERELFGRAPDREREVAEKAGTLILCHNLGSILVMNADATSLPFALLNIYIQIGR